MTGISQIGNIKNSVITWKADPKWKSGHVTVCQICGWYGYPQENILVEFEGIRSEDEDGFVEKFAEYDYDTEAGEKRDKHIHKYNPELVQELVDLAVESRNGI